MKKLQLPVALASGILLVLVYRILVRPWQLRWGATDAEVKRSMPGDDLVGQPTFNATRAVSIKAPAANIYPWIVQMGMTRAGWYSYDWLDNLARRSAEQILPEYQTIQIGSLVPLSPDGKQGMQVKDFSPNQWIVWVDKPGDTSWTWGIYPEGQNQTRLVTRVRVKYRWLSPSLFFNLMIEFCDLPMMRKCLLGIQRRAEGMVK